MAGDARIGSSSEVRPDSTFGPTWADQSTGWRAFRRALIVSWLILIAVAVAVGERPASYAQLKGDVVAGRVHAVRVAGDLQPRATGFSVVEVHWRRGPFRYETDVIAAWPRRRAPRHPSSYGATAVIGESVTARLTALQPDLSVVRVSRTGGFASLWGWRLPGWMLAAAFVFGLGTLVLLGGPRPWRATRWAWFWLIAFAAPVGVPAFLFLSGPTPPLPAPRPGAKRLTGGWALLLGVVLHQVLTRNP